jgi:catechol 2,3-dioxygenase
MLEFRHLQLRVHDLARSADFYVRQLGFVLSGENRGRAGLAVEAGGPVRLTLIENPAASPAPRDAAGLFHSALLLPSRAALGNWLRRAADAGVEFEGFSDHGVSEAVYLADPDGNGLEFYVDRPPETWPRRGGEIAMSTLPLDLPGLLAEGAKATPAASPLAGARWGHLHLRVTDLDRSETFYNSALGVSVTQRSYPGARFLAADGYHHHLGLNTWGHPRRPRPATALGLAEATFAHPGLAAEKHLTDPDGIPLHLVGA